MRTAFPVVVFTVMLAGWTWGLLHPNPVPPAVGNNLSLDFKYLAAKSLHVGVYAVLTLLASWLPISRMYFWIVIVGLAIHAIGTEIGQTYVPNRTGSATDVLFDCVGIGLAVLVIRLRQT